MAQPESPPPAQLSLSALVREYVLPYNTLFAVSGVVAFVLGLISPVLVVVFGSALLALCLSIVAANRFAKASLVAWAGASGANRAAGLFVRLLWPTPTSRLRNSGLFWAVAIMGAAVTLYGATSATQRGAVSSGPPATSAVQHAAPLILVFPFSAEASSERDRLFADALTEEVIFGLSRFSALRVMGRNSTAAIKTSGADLAAIRAKYGVRYVVDGSFRSTTDRYRLALELVDASTGVALWSDVLQGPQQQVPEVSHEVVQSIVGRVASKIAKHDLRPASGVPSDAKLSAYELTLKARALWNRPNKETLPQAQALLEKAIAIDPSYAPAFAYLAFTQLTSYNNSWSPGFAKPETLNGMVSFASRALEIDPQNATAHAARAVAYMYLGRHADGEAAARQALKANQHDPDTLGRVGQVLSFAGDQEGAIKLLKSALDLDPFGPAQWFNFLSRAHLFKREFNAAIAEAQNCLERANIEPCRETLVAALALAKRTDEAATGWKEIAAKRGEVEPEQVVSRLRPAFKNPRDPDLLVSGLKSARDAAR